MGRKAAAVGELFEDPEEVQRRIDELEREEAAKGNEKGDGKTANKDATSAWMKAMRLRKEEDALYWLWIMEEQFGEYYCGLQLIGFAGEDCWDPVCIQLAASLMTLLKDKAPNVWNHIAFVNSYCCKATKFWECEEGQARYRLAHAVRRRIVKGVDGKAIPEEIPSYAVDLHTTVGRALAKEKRWDEIDRRFSGDEVGIVCRIMMFQKYGRLDPEDGMDCYWAAHHYIKKLRAAEDEKDGSNG